MRLRLVALAALLLAGSASAQDILPDEEQSGPDWNRGLVWGIGAGGLGLAVAAGIAWFLGVGGLRHIDKHNVLEHPMRQSLLQVVEEQPGVHLRELANRHETAVTNTQWHLRKLEMAGLVKTEKVQGRRLYYPTRGGVVAKQEAVQNAAVSNPNAKAILEYVQVHPGTTQKGIADALEMNPGTVRWHIRKMDGAGLIKTLEEGSKVTYFPAQRSAPGDWRPERPSREAVKVEGKQ